MKSEPTITIDPEYESLIPPLSELERVQLEENLIANGCREPLSVQMVDEHNRVLLDGHNRYEICTRQCLEFKTRIELFPDATREDAKEWILRNQLGRRNLSPADAAELRGRIYNLRKLSKAEAGAKGGSNHQNDGCLTTAETIAKETGVSPATVERDGRYAKAVNEVAKVIPDVRAKVRSGEVSRQQVVKAAKHVDESPEAVVKATLEPVLMKGRQPKRPDLRDTYCVLLTVANGDPVYVEDEDPSSGIRMYSSSRGAELAQVEFERTRYGEHDLEVVTLTEYFRRQSALLEMQKRGAE